MTIFERKTYRHEELPARLASILATIRSVYEPERIILFGSAAQGGDWHDLDLLVVAKTTDAFYERLKKIAHAFARGPHTSTDVIILTPAELEEGIERDLFFLVEEILKKGRIVYEEGRSARVG